MSKIICLGLVAIVVSCLSACAGSQPQTKAGVEVCAVALSAVPFVRQESLRVGLEPLAFARLGCETGVLVGQTIEQLVRESRAASCARAPSEPIAGASSF
jgi:O-antigen ligase